MLKHLFGQQFKFANTSARNAKKISARAWPFIPAPDTPLAHHPAGEVNVTRHFIALDRLLNPHRLIPNVSALAA
jgi:hypothetical protein